jgi:hypothetical protein
MRRVLGVVPILALTGLGMVSVAAADSPSNPPSQPPPSNGQAVQGQFVPAKGSPLRIRGAAKIIRGAHQSTKLSVHASGLQSTKAYPTQVHSGACPENGPHYMQDPNGAHEPPNELWASSDPADPKGQLQSNTSGNAKGYGAATWVARPEARSVVIQSPDSGNPPLACADLQ